MLHRLPIANSWLLCTYWKIGLTKFIEDKTLQLVLVKLSDMIIDEHVQIEKLEPLLVEIENSKPIEFELINNYWHMAILLEQ